MTFAAAGSFQSIEDVPSGPSSAYALTTVSAGDWVLLELAVNTQPAVAVSGGLGGGIWEQISPAAVSLPLLNGTQGYGTVWAGKVTRPGTSNVTVTFAGTPGNSRFVAREFSVTTGNMILDVQGSVTSATSSWASLTPAGAGELYWGYCEDAASAVAGSTPGFVYEVDGNGNGEGYCLSVSATYTPVWGDATMQAGVMVLMKEVPPYVGPAYTALMSSM